MKQNLKSVVDLTLSVLIILTTSTIFHTRPQTALAQLPVKIKVPKIDSPKPQPSPVDSGQPASPPERPAVRHRKPQCWNDERRAVRPQTCAA